jgi:asparagine synthase (glutamine-hydrolysing)
LGRQHVTVALSGDGGDEVFGGYLLYRADKLANLYRRFPSWLRDTVIPAGVALLPASERKTSIDYKLKRFVRAASLPAPQAHIGWKTLFQYELRKQLLLDGHDHDVALDLMDDYYRAGPEQDAIGRMLHVDTLLSLPDDMLTKVDRTTMAVSLEARVPLLDRAVVEFMARLPSSLRVHGWELKYLFKRAVAEILPPTIIHRKKEGFNVPIARWLRQDLRDFTLETLSPQRVRATQLLDEVLVTQTLEEHLAGHVDRGRELWSVLMFVLWHKHYVEDAEVPTRLPPTSVHADRALLS